MCIDIVLELHNGARINSGGSLVFSVISVMMEEGRIPCQRLKIEHSLRKSVEIGVVQFERWNRLKKEASSSLLTAFTHETFSQRLMDCWERHAT